MRGKLTKAVLWAALGGMVLGSAGGCSISSTSDVHRSGTCVDADAFARIELGKTTAQQVRSLLGEPNESQTTASGVELWTWRYSEKKESRGEFLIFKGSDKKDISAEACVELKDGIVIAKRRNDSTDQKHEG